MDRQELKAKLPHGYGRIIAKELGVTPKAVYDFLNGRTNSYKIERAVLRAVSKLTREKEAYLNDIV
ncbi:hypothetical protein [Sphingobacterium cavernae]|uniref:hypothetical protein n=1 Tax=Sphingobacterium cavernae TaxID=2592657 RepID=UPI00122FC9AC|nr:hypothetical protein [Sphingobacterium cavernae]